MRWPTVLGGIAVIVCAGVASGVPDSDTPLAQTRRTTSGIAPVYPPQARPAKYRLTPGDQTS